MTCQATCLFRKAGKLGRPYPHEPNQLRNAESDHHDDGGRGAVRWRRHRDFHDADGHFPALRLAADLHCSDLQRHESFPNGRTDRQSIRAELSVRQRHQERRVEERSANVANEAFVLPRHQHGAGDGRGGRPGESRPGHDAQERATAADHADGRRQFSGRISGARQSIGIVGHAG